MASHVTTTAFLNAGGVNVTTQPGDYIVMAVTSNDNNTDPVPSTSGWTLIHDTTGSGSGYTFRFKVWIQYAYGTSYSCNHNSLNAYTAVTVWRGLSGIVVNDGNWAGAATSFSIPQVGQATRGHEMLIMGSIHQNDVDTSYPALTEWNEGARSDPPVTKQVWLGVNSTIKVAGASTTSGTLQFADPAGGATNGNNNSAWVRLILETPDRPPSNPGAPVVPSTVNGSHTITFTPGVDPDGDPVQHWMDYSGDSGATWTRIVNGIVGGTVTYDFSAIAETSGATGRVRVMAGRNPDVGLYSAWVTSNAFTVFHNTVPTAPTGLSPATGAAGQYNNGATFAWTHNDADGSNTQGAFALRRRIGTAAYEYYNITSGAWQATEIFNSYTTSAYAFPAGKWAPATYGWSVATRDTGGKQSPYSAEATVTSQGAPSATVTAPANNLASSLASSITFSWTYSDPNSEAQAGWFLRAYWSGTTYFWNATNQAFQTTEVMNAGTDLSEVIPAANFPRGKTIVWAVKVQDTTGLQSNYVGDRIINTAPATPTSVTPAASATVNTNLTTFGLTLTAGDMQQRGEWQYSKSSTFASGNITLTQPVGSLAGSGTRTMTADTATKLSQGTWYVRARTIDVNGLYSPYTATQSFTVAHAPTASNLTPTGGEIRQGVSGGSTVFDWDFVDTSPDDVQTAFQYIVERNSDGVQIADSGKIATATTSAGFGHTTNLNVQMRWKVRLWDSGDVVGPYSGYSVFTVGDVPTVSITSPTDGGTTGSGAPSVSWSYTGARAQASYQVRIYEGATLLYDSGVLSGTATTFTVPTVILENNHSYTARVDVTDTAALTNNDTNAFTTAYAVPTNAPYVVNTSFFNADGFVRVTWDNSTKDPNWTGWKVYRRITGGGTNDWVEIYRTTSDQTEYVFDDYYCTAQESWDYAVVQEVVRFGETLESNKGAVATGPIYTEYYWLLHPEDDTRHIRLYHVNEDGFEIEYEQEVHNIVGRGRRVDNGDRLGVKGSISCKLYPDAATGKGVLAQRRDLEDARNESTDHYLRNPWGDIWRVALGNLQFSRDAGTGPQDERGSFSFTYLQVS